jgi:hypothetical protein
MQTIGIRQKFENDVVLFDVETGDIFYRRLPDGTNARTIEEYEGILSGLTVLSNILVEGKKYEYDKTIKILLDGEGRQSTSN